MRITMLTSVGDHAKGAVVPVDDAVGQKYIDAGFAQKAPDANPLDNLSELVAKVIEGVNAANAKTHANHPANARIDAGESPADRKKSFGEFLHHVGVVGVPGHPGREKSVIILSELYGSPMDTTFGERYANSATKGLAGNNSFEANLSRKAALAEASGITGGYLVPPEYSSRLLSLAPEDTVLVGKTDDYHMTGTELVMPVLDQTTAPTAGNTGYTAGMIMNWTAEAQTRTETEPKFKELRLKANELAGYALASRNVVFDNVVALEQRLTQLFAGAIGWYRDFAYLQGSGVGLPQGILNSNATILVNRQSANLITYQDSVKMYGSLLPQSVKNAYWIMQQSVLQAFLQMKDASSRLVIQPYYPGPQGGPAAVRPVMTLLGLPILTTEKLPTLGTKGDVLLVDPKQYFTGTRQDIEIAASEHFKFINNQMTYRALFRGDGKSWMDAPLTLQDTTSQLSPFVCLN